ncbi:MAG: glycosyltransferase [Elusimicrobia bacterium]|nr:glycosyltransferase [Candidatus Liberimonas magnetica]
MKIRIFYLSTSLNIGGTEKFLFTLIQSMVNEYEFTVGYIKEKGHIGELLEKNNVKVVHLPGFFAILKFLKENEFDMLHTFLFRANILGRIAGKIAKVPVIMSTQQAVDDWKCFYHAWLDGYTAQWCNLIIANSQAAKDLLCKREKIPASKIAVVYNGLDFKAFRPGRTREAVRNELKIETDIPIVAYIGRLHKEKGADFLPELIDKLKHCAFIIAGDGPEKEMLEGKLRHLNAEKRVKLLGWRNDIADLLSASDIYILPSREESFPQSILEAMSCSLPVVAMNVGGVRELVQDEHNGVLVNHLDIEKFSDAVDGLLKDIKKAKEFGFNGHNKSLNYSNDKMIGQVKSLYENMLSRTRAHQIK